MLDEVEVEERMALVVQLLHQEIKVSSVLKDIQEQLEKKMEKYQREQVLKE